MTESRQIAWELIIGGFFLIFAILSSTYLNHLDIQRTREHLNRLEWKIDREIPSSTKPTFDEIPPP